MSNLLFGGEKSDREKSKEWWVGLARHAKIGLTVVAFCKPEGVSRRSFYVWTRKFGAEGQAEGFSFGG